MVRSMIWNIALNYSRTLAQKSVTIIIHYHHDKTEDPSDQHQLREGRIQKRIEESALHRGEAEANHRLGNNNLGWSLQTLPRYNAACAALQRESQTEDNENTGKESNYRKTRQHKDKSYKVDHRYNLSINNKTFSNMDKGSGY
ncbi:hypothetical protein C0J52_27029 [Blattella germanica]|nr:hypothetical protein C0J52_27029 [Blattella germanica]